MRLTVSSYSFEAIPLDGALAVVKAMGFKGTDIGGFHNRGKASLEPDEVAANPKKFADDLKRLLDKHELEAVDYFPQFGSSPAERSTNSPDSASREKNLASMRGIVQFCKLVGIPSMTVLPGVDHTDRPLEANLDASAAELKKWVEIARKADIELCFEPHMGSVADTPELGIALCERAPGSKITLDYSHYILQYIPVERIHRMIPYAGHVHIRQAREGKLQSRYNEGVIDFVDIVKRLKAANYQHCLSIEYVCMDWFGANDLDTLAETMSTKAALEQYVGV